MGSFFVEDIPANGYKTFVLTDEVPVNMKTTLVGDERAGFIENQWYKITFDKSRGCIKSIWDKMNKRELVDPNAKDGFGSYVYERYDKKQSLQYLKEYIYDDYKKSHYCITGKSTYLDDHTKGVHEAARRMELYVEDHKSSIQAILVPSISIGEEKHTSGMKVILYENMPYIDIKLSVVNKPATEEPEAGWIALPFQTKEPVYRIGRLGSVIDPAKDLIEGSQFNYIWSNSGLMIKDKDYSIGICALDAPAVQLGDLNFMHFADKYENPQSHLYFNLFNNRWNTNFTSFWNGNLTTEVRLWVNQPSADDALGLVVPAWETRLPLQVGIATCSGGKLPVENEGVKVSRKGVLVTAYGHNLDGEGKLLRLWEETGESSSCEVSLPVKKDGIAQPVNLRGIPCGQPIKIQNGKFKVQLTGFAPASYLIY